MPGGVRRRVAAGLLRLTGWHVVGEAPRAGVLIGAPHTSNWDAVLGALFMWRSGAPARIMIKREAFIGPIGPLLRRLGAVEIDRSDPSAVVRRLSAEAAAGHGFLLAMAPEGSRRPGEHWKSGFYRIAHRAGQPVALGFVDGPSRTVGVGPSFVPTGDVAADMDRVRAFYADKRGVRPGARHEPRLREEGTGTTS